MRPYLAEIAGGKGNLEATDGSVRVQSLSRKEQKTTCASRSFRADSTASLAPSWGPGSSAAVKLAMIVTPLLVGDILINRWDDIYPYVSGVAISPICFHRGLRTQPRYRRLHSGAHLESIFLLQSYSVSRAKSRRCKEKGKHGRRSGYRYGPFAVHPRQGLVTNDILSHLAAAVIPSAFPHQGVCLLLNGKPAFVCKNRWHHHSRVQ